MGRKNQIIGYRRNGCPIYAITGGSVDVAPAPVRVDFLQSLYARFDENTAAIEAVVQRAQTENRELTPDEDAELTRHAAAAESLKPQIERFSKLREFQTDVAVQRAAYVPAPHTSRIQVIEHTDPAPVDGPTEERVQRSAGHFVRDQFNAARGDQDAASRVERALAKVLTSDTPGLLPVTYIGDMLGTISGSRPLVNGAVNRLPLPESGMEFRRPRITGHTTVGEQTTEKTEVPSSKFTVTFDTIGLRTFAGAVNVSIQEMRRTDPAATNLIFQDLSAQYALQTEAAVATALTSAVTQTQALPANATIDQIRAAVYGGAGQVYAGTDSQLPNVIVASIDQWARLGAFSATVNPQNGTVDANPTSLNITIAGVPVVVSKSLPAGTLLLGRREALEFLEDPEAPVQLSALEVGILGYELGVYGMFGVKVTNPTAWTSLKPAA